MSSLTNIFKKKEQNADEAPQSQSFFQKNRLPICVGAVCLLLVAGYLFKTFFQNKKTVPDNVTFDCSATLAAVGDISLSAKQLRSFHTDTDGYDFSKCFLQVAQSISSADFAIGNLEGCISTDESRAESNVLPASFVTSLSACGFDLLQTANSYSIQNGISSIDTTMNALDEHGIIAEGTYRSAEERASSGGCHIIEINGIRIAVIAFTKGLNNMHLPDGSEYAVNLLYKDYDTEYSKINEDGILECINNAKAEAVDFIIAMVHWGSENEGRVSESQQKIADLLVENGVDVIIGSHSHIVSQIEHRLLPLDDGTWKNVYIAYSLGDFLTSSEQAKTQYSCILNLKFEKDSTTGRCAITDMSYTPTYCTSPSKSQGTTEYTVIDSLNAIQLREEQYYNAVSETLCETLINSLEKLAEQTETDAQIVKDFSK